MASIISQLPFKAALVTGGSARIGEAIVRRLVASGLAVAVHHRKSGNAAKALVREINQTGGCAVVVEGDLADGAALACIMRDAATGLAQPIDVLVNNASVFQNDSLGEISLETWDIHQNVNLRAPVFLAQALAKALPIERQGCIINLIDQRVLKLNPQYFSYTAAKAGLWTVTRTMAQSMAPRIRVNAISPGPTLANNFQSVEDFNNEAHNVLLKKGPKLKEITGAVTFLLETTSMTGQMLTLDGGQHLAWHTKDIIVD